MQALLAAIQSKFTTASLPSTIAGGLHLEQAPAAAVMPYAVMHVIASPTTQNYGSSFYTEPQIDFVVRGVGANAALVLCESLRDAFKDQILTLGSGKMLNAVLTMDATPEPQDPTTDEQDRDTFGWIVSFRFSTT